VHNFSSSMLIASCSDFIVNFIVRGENEFTVVHFGRAV